MHQFVYNHLPLSLSRCWLNNVERKDDGPALLDEDDFIVDFFLLFCTNAHLSPTDRHPVVVFPKSWNERDALEPKSTSPKNVFNKSLKKFLIDTLDSDFKCSCLLHSHLHL
jgi:hypothetical protein